MLIRSPAGPNSAPATFTSRSASRVPRRATDLRLAPEPEAAVPTSRSRRATSVHAPAPRMACATFEQNRIVAGRSQWSANRTMHRGDHNVRRLPCRERPPRRDRLTTTRISGPAGRPPGWAVRAGALPSGKRSAADRIAASIRARSRVTAAARAGSTATTRSMKAWLSSKVSRRTKTFTRDRRQQARGCRMPERGLGRDADVRLVLDQAERGKETAVRQRLEDDQPAARREDTPNLLQGAPFARRPVLMKGVDEGHRPKGSGSEGQILGDDPRGRRDSGADARAAAIASGWDRCRRYARRGRGGGGRAVPDRIRRPGSRLRREA